MTQSNPLNLAIEVSYEILDKLSQSELDNVSQLEATRQSLINEYFSSSVDLDEVQVRLLKKLNDDILQRLKQMQSKIQDQQTSLKRANKASKAYLENS